MKVAENPLIARADREERYSQICDLFEQILKTENTLAYPLHEIMTSFRLNCESELESRLEVSVQSLWLDIISGFKQLKGLEINQNWDFNLLGKGSAKFDAAERLSRMFIELETSPMEWRQMQFNHIKSFVKTVIQVYSNVVKNFMELIHVTIHYSKEFKTFQNQKTKNEVDRLASLDWKLRNSKKCPNCSVMINRDDG
ncbi:hypothetical protein HK096_006895, partial [Nowakowskiella sp. JEL0078]